MIYLEQKYTQRMNVDWEKNQKQLRGMNILKGEHKKLV